MADPGQQTMADPGPQSCPVAWFVLIRFNNAYALDFTNSINKHRSILERCYFGRCVGMAEHVGMVENSAGQWHEKHAVALFEFPSEKLVNQWLQSMPDVRQSDWLHGIDIVYMPARTGAPANRPFVALLDAHIQNEDRFFNGYAMKAAEQLRNRKDVTVAVVASDRVCKVRGQWDPDYVVLHFFDCPTAFESYTSSDEQKAIEPSRHESAQCDSIVFQMCDA